jgi:hypothetical protein
MENVEFEVFTAVVMKTTLFSMENITIIENTTRVAQ